MAHEIDNFKEAQTYVNWYIAKRGWDQYAIWSWLVIEEDYADGCTFTEEQLIEEVDAWWKRELVRREIFEAMEDVAEIVGMNDDQVEAIARNIALNHELIRTRTIQAISKTMK